MVGNLLDQQIINIFNNDLTQFYSINAISKKLNKAYPHINQKVNSLIDEGIIKKTVFGKSFICTIDMNNDLALAYLSIDEINNKAVKQKKMSSALQNKAEIILESGKTKNIIYSKDKLYVIIDKENLKHFSKIIDKNILFLSYEEFKSLLIKDSSILKDHIILQSYENYFKIIKEVIGQIRLLSM